MDFQATHAVDLSKIEEAKSTEELSPELLRIHMSFVLKASNQAETAYLLNREGNNAADVFEARMRAYIFYLQMSPLNYEGFIMSKHTRIDDFNDYIESEMEEAGT